MPHPTSKPRPVLRGPTATLSGPPRRDEGLPFKTLLSMAAVQFSTGGLFLGIAWFSTPMPGRSWAGALILAVAIVQGKLVLKALKQRRVARGNPFRRTSFWRTTFVGLVLCYVAALALGPIPETPYAFAAAVSVWHTLTLLPIAVSPQILEAWKQISQKRTPRKTGNIVVAGLLAMVVMELGLRGYAWLEERTWLAKASAASAQVDATPVVSDRSEALMNRDSMLAQDSRFHVAIVADQEMLGGTDGSAAFSQLEMLTPGVRVTHFDAKASEGAFSESLAQRVIACRPNLVLSFVSAGDDVLSQRARSEWFDWRSLAVAQTFLASEEDRSRPTTLDSSIRAGSESKEALLLEAGRELRICRTPIDRATDQRWKKAFKHLDGLVRECRESRIEVALVVVPSAFQVNGILCETLCRRMGYDAKTIDVDLPQRRLVTFAGDRGIGCVDLTPHLRRCEEPPYEHSGSGWNDEGTAVAVYAIGRWIESRYRDTLAMTGQVSRK